MSGNKKALLDSNILIYASKGMIDVASIANTYPFLYISIITYVEVTGYPFEDTEEEAIMLDILRHIPVVNLDMEIAEQTSAYRRLKKIKLPDAFILATAHSLKADLLTFNTKDFEGVDLKVNIIKPTLKIQ